MIIVRCTLTSFPLLAPRASFQSASTRNAGHKLLHAQRETRGELGARHANAYRALGAEGAATQDKLSSLPPETRCNSGAGQAFFITQCDAFWAVAPVWAVARVGQDLVALHRHVELAHIRRHRRRLQKLFTGVDDRERLCGRCLWLLPLHGRADADAMHVCTARSGRASSGAC